MDEFVNRQAMQNYPYASRRSAAVAREGMVATSQHLAAEAGLEIMRGGGNAVDAAVAAAACLTVVEPTSNGIGGDNFAIVWHKDRMYGMNSSGPAPQELSIEQVKSCGNETMPKFGWTPVTVPGVPAGWEALNQRFGKLPLETVLQPAVRYARNGFAVTPVVAHYWNRAAQAYAKQKDAKSLFGEWFRVFTDSGRAPQAGEVWKLPEHAVTLESIGKYGGKVFYDGAVGDVIDSASRKHDGYLRKGDLEGFTSQWVDPVSVTYNGYRIWELPPNVQGIIALMALQIMKSVDSTAMREEELTHYQIEALKLAFVDGLEHITDVHRMRIDYTDLLTESYGQKRSLELNAQAADPKPLDIPSGGTVYLSAADAEGTMVSFIQSNYMGFGSGIVVPGTGIALQNRGHTFSLDPRKANCLEPGKKTYHTIMPGFITKPADEDGQGDGKDIPVGPFGVMGGFMQPQGHMQVAMNLIDKGMNPQAALDAPRWQWTQGRSVLVEDTLPASIIEHLKSSGHDITCIPSGSTFGRGQAIVKNEHGVLVGGTDPRADGAVCSW